MLQLVCQSTAQHRFVKDGLFVYLYFRVVVPASMETKTDAAQGHSAATAVVAGVCLPGFNSHSATSTEPYMNAAASVGQTPGEIHLFVERLDKALANFAKRSNSKSITQPLQDDNTS